MNLKSLKNKLSKLEQVKRKMAIEADCICFPPDQPPVLLLQAEREAAQAVLCPLGYLGIALLRAFEVAEFEQRLERLEERNELEEQAKQT